MDLLLLPLFPVPIVLFVGSCRWWVRGSGLLRLLGGALLIAQSLSRRVRWSLSLHCGGNSVILPVLVRTLFCYGRMDRLDKVKDQMGDRCEVMWCARQLCFRTGSYYSVCTFLCSEGKNEMAAKFEQTAAARCRYLVAVSTLTKEENISSMSRSAQSNTNILDRPLGRSGGR